ncbi:MAG: ABC transporter permease subunit [Armatimonadetes bacterium]|nr:ABC transporter permease subunit [Armatimonadota bacterium]
MANAPIADLSYRNYDGALEPPSKRWTVIARHSIRRALKLKSFWVLSALSGWHFAIIAAWLYMMDNIAGATSPQFVEQFYKQVVWRDVLLNGIAAGQLMWMALGLVLGAGCIANDNRTNALLVYLSKPVGKGEYLLGKFVGLAVPLLLALAIPVTVFLVYGSLNWRGNGFLTDDPWMIPKTLVVLPVMAAFNAALLVGFSSLASNARVSGAVYAGFYFIIKFFVFLLTGAGRLHGMPEAIRPTLEKISYLSIDGLPYGFAKVVFGTDGSPFWIIKQGPEHVIARPPLFLVLPLIVGFGALGLGIAWSRIRAVEVVK